VGTIGEGGPERKKGLESSKRGVSPKGKKGPFRKSDFDTPREKRKQTAATARKKKKKAKEGAEKLEEN